ncbi:hypothetical protein AAY473_038446 [Plecturocebus cupreus]
MDKHLITRQKASLYPIWTSPATIRGKESKIPRPLLPKNPLELIPVLLHLNSQSVLLQSHLFEPTFPQLGLCFHLLLRIFLFLPAPLSVCSLLVALGTQGILGKLAGDRHSIPSQRSQKPSPYHLLLGKLHHHLVRQLLLGQQLCFLFLVFIIDALNLSLHLQFLLLPSFHVLPGKGHRRPLQPNDLFTVFVQLDFVAAPDAVDLYTFRKQKLLKFHAIASHLPPFLRRLNPSLAFQLFLSPAAALIHPTKTGFHHVGQAGLELLT